MSVSEWTEGLKKKEASLIYVNPSVTACAVPAPSKREPFGRYLNSCVKPPSFREVDVSKASRRKELERAANSRLYNA